MPISFATICGKLFFEHPAAGGSNKAYYSDRRTDAERRRPRLSVTPQITTPMQCTLETENIKKISGLRHRLDFFHRSDSPTRRRGRRSISEGRAVAPIHPPMPE